ncbi:MAG: type IV pilin bioproteinis protein, partial [bacterium]
AGIGDGLFNDGIAGGALHELQRFQDRQVEAAVEGLAALIEPLLIVVVGIIVGVVVITMYLPIFYLGDAILHGNW